MRFGKEQHTPTVLIAAQVLLQAVHPSPAQPSVQQSFKGTLASLLLTLLLYTTLCMVKNDKRKLHKLTGISSTAGVPLTTGHTLMSPQQNVYTDIGHGWHRKQHSSALCKALQRVKDALSSMQRSHPATCSRLSAVRQLDLHKHMLTQLGDKARNSSFGIAMVVFAHCLRHGGLCLHE